MVGPRPYTTPRLTLISLIFSKLIWFDYHHSTLKNLPILPIYNLARIVLIKSIDERCFMGAFWNPNGGFIVSDRKLSKKEVAVLKRRWSENPQLQFSQLGRWWDKIKFAVLAILS